MTINPWDVQPVPDRGSDAETLYRHVGHALSRWESFETSLATLFSFLTGARKKPATAAYMAYGTIVSFSGRAEMVRAASGGYFNRHANTVLQRRCHDLVRDALRYSPRRNEIAHGIALPYSLVLKDKSGSEWVLTATWYAYNKRKWTEKSISLVPDIGVPKYIYSHVEVAAYSDTFSQLATQAIKLGNDIRDGVVRPDDDYVR